MAENAPSVISDTELSNSFMGDTIQTCVVTNDIYRTMKGFAQLGVGPWRIYRFDPNTVTEQTYRGREQPYSMRLAVAWTGSSFWEIIQPLDEGDTIYRDWIEKHGEGIQHVAQACNPLTFEEQIATFKERGLEVIQSGFWRGEVRYAYIGSEDLTGMAIELFSFPEGYEFPEPEEWFPAAPPSTGK